MNIIKIFVPAIMGLVAYLVTNNIIGTMGVPEGTVVAAQEMLNLMPVVVGVSVVVGSYVIICGGAVAIRYLKWSDYGNRLKAAYTAKFGYENPAFNEEINQHIAVMRALGRGRSKELAKDWLKRMAEFVEVPWAIPEEEYLSEEEKTEEFGE